MRFIYHFPNVHTHRPMSFQALNLECLSPWSFQERLSEQLEGQRQEQALQRYHSEAEELDHWLLSTRATLSSALHPVNEDLDMEEQLIDCQVRFTFLLEGWMAGKLSTERFCAGFMKMPTMSISMYLWGD